MGGTPYKGRWRPLEWFQPVPLRTSSLKPRRLPQHHPSTAWKTISWNAGGLTAGIYQELQTYIRLHNVDLAIIQETKWRFDSSWSSADYHYIHSQGLNKEDKVGGVLTIIAARHAKETDIQYSVLHPGRLLHVRLPRGTSHVDVLNCYQYAVNEQEGVFDRRLQLFTRLQRCLHGLPQRNSLIMGGDLNCPMEVNQPTCGPCVLSHNLMYYRDHKDLQNILQTAHLCVLNTWTKPQHGQLATYTFGKIATQIDFLITRRRQANAEARQAHPLTSFPVGAWREGGNHHPVMAHIAVPKFVKFVQQDKQKPPTLDQEALRQDLVAPVESPALHALRQDVQDQLVDVATLSSTPLQAAQTHYPCAPPAPRRPDQPVELANSAKHMWGIFREMRKQQFSARGVVTAWRLWVQFQRAHQIHKQRSRKRIRHKRDDLLEQANAAAHSGNLFGLWKVVKQFAPKAPRKRLQLHQEGRILSTNAELKWILEAYGDRYGEASTEDVVALDIPSSHKNVQICPQELAGQLRALHARKAVPKGTAPPILLKACNESVATVVARQVNHDWQSHPPHVEQDWADASVALLPKPHGRSRSPLDWRPIGIQGCPREVRDVCFGSAGQE